MSPIAGWWNRAGFKGFDRRSLTARFAVVGGIVSLLAGLSLAYYQRTTAIDQLERMAEENNVALTRAFGNSVWPRFSAFLDRASTMPAESVRRHTLTKELHNAVSDLMGGTTVLKMKLYHLNGRTVYSTDPRQIGDDYSGNARLLKALNADSARLLEFRETFNAFDGPVAGRYVLSSYVPISRYRGGTVEGVAEIYNDVTAFYEDLIYRGSIQAAIVAAVLFLVYASLLLFVWRIDLRVQAQHRREIELSANVARAEASSRAKTEFLANMSHELRTPLNAIIGFADMIHGEQMGPVGSPVYSEYAGAIGVSGRQLLDLINRVIDVAKVEAGQIEIERETANVIDVLGEAVEMMRHRAAEARLSLRFVAPDESLYVTSDLEKIRQIALNLIGNGIKFTEPGGEISVEIAGDRDAGTFEMRVSDNGIGMRDEDIPFALAPFCQIGNGLARKFDGAGLGLPISKSFAEILGGNLEIDSALGEGTSVRIVLPCWAPQAPSAENATSIAA